VDEFELLRKIVSIDSPFGKEDGVSDFIVALLEGHGIDVKVLPVEGHGGDVVARLDGTGPTVVLNGHMDTVHPSSGWTRDVHGELDGDRFYGLGSADMKAGLSALLAAFIELSERSPAERPNVIFTAVSDEEGYSRGTWELIRSGELDGADVVLVGEPTSERLMLGARGRFVIRLVARGRKAHAARPWRGVNAVEELARVVGAIGDVETREHPLLGPGSYCTLSFSGNADGLSVPDCAEAVVDRHIVVGEDWNTVKSELEGLVCELGLKARVCVEKFPRPTPEMPPYVVDERNPFVASFEESHRKVAGRAPGVTYGRSVGDFNYFAAYLGKPTLVYGPIGGNWHASDEWVSLSSLRRIKRVYMEFLTVLSKKP